MEKVTTRYSKPFIAWVCLIVFIAIWPFWSAYGTGVVYMADPTISPFGYSQNFWLDWSLMFLFCFGSLLLYYGMEAWLEYAKAPKVRAKWWSEYLIRHRRLRRRWVLNVTD